MRIALSLKALRLSDFSQNSTYVFTSGRGLSDCVLETKNLAVEELPPGGLCNAIIRPWIALDETTEIIEVAEVAIHHRKSHCSELWIIFRFSDWTKDQTTFKLIYLSGK
ncbi:MAG: hypothetical protein ACREEM_40265 [Blastocatellia bacterium]